ncbi:MAG: hypothetical protein WA431_06495 [Candidatus Cybelea sp.]
MKVEGEPVLGTIEVKLLDTADELEPLLKTFPTMSGPIDPVELLMPVTSVLVPLVSLTVTHFHDCIAGFIAVLWDNGDAPEPVFVEHPPAAIAAAATAMKTRLRRLDQRNE